MGDKSQRSPAERFANTFLNFLESPVVWFREKVVVPNRPTYYWYHQKFRRVPTIEECYTDDPVCFAEADKQFKRDRLVDTEIINILRQRYEDCVHYETPNVEKCRPIYEQYLQETENWFIKYGDLGGYGDVRTAYMKQKHRMIWERRHGPVGTGMRSNVSEG